ncbi:ATP synthase F(0) complex subunit B1, mitochondrial-like [Watersipora subatra]|uniref:ATP synthase F(0) complex subunit B1, mitochondrial-like n=1 Tax=Watersipora subatra TaxID=2589382 RepID=UPI00355B1E2C
MPAMFSRLAFRNGLQLSATLRSGQVQPLVAAKFHTDTKDTKKTEELIKRWDECNQKYFGPHRDLVNHPHPVMGDSAPPTTLYFIPRSWVDALYEKTGVSGPYFTLAGLLTFVMSKEIWVVDHSFFEFLAFYAGIIYIIRKFGNSVEKTTTSIAELYNDTKFGIPMRNTRSAFTAAVGKIDTKIDEEARHSYVYDVQQENVDLQLEARYRERVAQVYSAVKRRLDYQVELVNTRKRFEQQHMVDWIVNSVVQGITPKQEKDAIASCISNLKALSKSGTAV